ncbi:hypothetical protein EOB59_31985 [Mesorhizobium sp. M7A.F.Ca.MR.176.00.0.0]|nr:hypothetical protein EOB59_31985 [Mesorhizobium sp. M7A.F.Ca.MR.176.00.0.0]
MIQFAANVSRVIDILSGGVILEQYRGGIIFTGRRRGVGLALTREHYGSVVGLSVIAYQSLFRSRLLYPRPLRHSRRLRRRVVGE